MNKTKIALYSQLRFLSVKENEREDATNILPLSTFQTFRLHYHPLLAFRIKAFDDFGRNACYHTVIGNILCHYGICTYHHMISYMHRLHNLCPWGYITVIANDTSTHPYIHSGVDITICTDTACWIHYYSSIMHDIQPWSKLIFI